MKHDSCCPSWWHSGAAGSARTGSSWASTGRTTASRRTGLTSGRPVTITIAVTSTICLLLLLLIVLLLLLALAHLVGLSRHDRDADIQMQKRVPFRIPMQIDVPSVTCI